MNYAADDEAEGNNPRRRFAKRRGKHPGVKRRTDTEKAISVVFPPAAFYSLLTLFQRRVREHMATLIPRANWLQDLIHPDELQTWDPEGGPCCTPAAFKLNFRGTPRDNWNISASRVFTDHFLITHSDLYDDTWQNRGMVLKKTQAYIKTLLRYYRQKSVGEDVLRQTRVAHRRRERKAAVSFSSSC